MLTNWQLQSKLRKFGAKFAVITHVDDAISCSGKVVELLELDGETLARCEIHALKLNGVHTLAGEALVEVGPRRELPNRVSEDRNYNRAFRSKV